MKLLGYELSWIVVKNLEEAIKFYTQVIGFKLMSHEKKFGWAELSSPKGAILGLAQENKEYHLKAGTNAVATFTVADILEARNHLKKNGVTLVGEVMEVPGHVKLQTFTDKDGNTFQLCETIE